MQSITDRDFPLAVDLDGTLTLTDTLHESTLLLIRKHPLDLFALPFWLAKGKAVLKAAVAGKVDLDVTRLPYNVRFIEWLKEERIKGRPLVLCTAADSKIGNAVAAHLGLFDSVISSNASRNLAGSNKRAALDDRFGLKGYDYAGNSRTDLPVWMGARRAIVVNAAPHTAELASEVSTVEKVFPPEAVRLSHWFRVLRVHQWLKNLLLFVPILAAHSISELQSLLVLLLAFVSFSVCASSVYISNDLLDLESDRRHPTKHRRPFACADVSIKFGVLLAPCLTLCGFLLGIKVGGAFVGWLALYFLLTCAYSLWLKRQALTDCFMLAALYVLRIIAGGAAVGITPSMWLLVFSVFIFLSLAFVKRYTELMVQSKIGNDKVHGRGYKVQDAQVISILGVTSGYGSVVVLALYLQSETVARLYTQPELILSAVPLMLFWVSWIWLKAHRSEMLDDPMVFALKDRVSLSVVGLIGLTFIVAAVGIPGAS